MIKINLVGDRHTRKVARRRGLVIMAACIGGTALVCSFAGLVLGASIARVQVERDEALRLSQNVQSMNKRIVSLEQQKKSLDPRVQVLTHLQEQSLQAIRVLSALSDTIPANVWLLEANTNEGALELMGLAPEDRFIADFVKRLSGEKLFSEVTLARARPAVGTTFTAQEFVIRAQLALSRPLPSASRPVVGAGR